MSFIKYQHYAICRNCKHYVPPTKQIKGKCQMFGEKNLETGEIVFMDAEKSRTDTIIGENLQYIKRCGSLALYFEEKIETENVLKN